MGRYGVAFLFLGFALTIFVILPLVSNAGYYP